MIFDRPQGLKQASCVWGQVIGVPLREGGLACSGSRPLDM